MRASTRTAGLAFVATLVAAWPAFGWRGSDEIAIGSTPSGAEVYVDDRLVGITPLLLPVPCDEVVDRRYRIVQGDCDPAEGIVYARPAPGRIVGMAFSLGITAIFQCPNYFVPVDVTLRGGSCGLSGRTFAVEQPQAAPTGDLAVRLRVLKDLHERGVLSDTEYDRERDNALGGL